MQNEKAPVTLIEALRLRTRALHDEAEKAMDIMSDQLTVDAYADKLRGMYSLYAGLQSALAGAVDARVARLARDLAYFRRETPAPALDENFNAQLRETYFRAGTLYVIEGSALGGQVVSRRLRERFSLTPEEGGAFFFGDGPKVGEVWRRTLADLAQLDGEPQHWEKVLMGAETTFRKFAAAFRDSANS